MKEVLLFIGSGIVACFAIIGFGVTVFLIRAFLVNDENK